MAVEGAGWLVRQQQARPVDQGARERHLLLLATAQVGRIGVGATHQPQLGEQPTRPLLRFLRPVPGEFCRNHDVLDHGQLIEQMKELEDDADALSPQAGPLGLIHCGQVDAVDPHGPFRRLVEAGNQVQERGLTTPRRPLHRHQLPGGNREGDAVEGRHAAVELAQRHSLDGRCHGPPLQRNLTLGTPASGRAATIRQYYCRLRPALIETRLGRHQWKPSDPSVRSLRSVLRNTQRPTTSRARPRPLSTRYSSATGRKGRLPSAPARSRSRL